MAGTYIFQRGCPISKGLYQGHLRAQKLMKLLKKQKVMGVCYTELPSSNTYSWESIITISWKQL
jgi:hypothetical protein